jgi:hypothetical protein
MSRCFDSAKQPVNLRTDNHLDPILGISNSRSVWEKTIVSINISRRRFDLTRNHPELFRTSEHRNIGTPEHRNTGTPEHRNTGTPEHRNTGTPEHRNTGTPEHRNIGTPEHRNPTT